MQQVIVASGQVLNQPVQPRIDLAEPAAVVHAVGDIFKLVRPPQPGIVKHLFFEDV